MTFKRDTPQRRVPLTTPTYLIKKRQQYIYIKKKRILNHEKSSCSLYARMLWVCLLNGLKPSPAELTMKYHYQSWKNFIYVNTSCFELWLKYIPRVITRLFHTTTTGCSNVAIPSWSPSPTRWLWRWTIILKIRKSSPILIRPTFAAYCTHNHGWERGALNSHVGVLTKWRNLFRV